MTVASITARTNRRLSLEEVLRGFAAYDQMVATLLELREQDYIYRHIQLPKLPDAFSVSLVRLLIEAGSLLPEVQPVREVFQADKPDIRITTADGRQLKVEVKGTAQQGYQRLSEHDRTADYLIWLSLASGKSDTIDLYVAADPDLRSWPKASVRLGEFVSHLRPLCLRVNLGDCQAVPRLPSVSTLG
jgi:hypothetical protein